MDGLPPNGLIIGLVPPPSADFTGICPCGCGAQFDDGEQVFAVPPEEPT